AYVIIYAETRVEPEVALQLAVKAINNTTGPNSLIPTLLIFRAYLRILENSPLLLLIT
ncbi:hypothetical protein LY78DRAFT_595412, partial [Colletotrichum sublineola]